MKSIIIIAAIAFSVISCNNPSSPAKTMTDSTSNSSVDTMPGNMNNTDTMSDMNKMDTTTNPATTDSMR